MNLIDKIILKLYLWRFPQKPLEQKPKVIFPEPQTIPITTIYGCCYVSDRLLKSGFISKDVISKRIISSMEKDLSQYLVFGTADDIPDEMGLVRVKASIDVISNNSNFKFGD